MKQIKIYVKRILGAENISKLSEFLKKKQDQQLGYALLKNKQFKNMYKGERCFIIGNGPSLNKLDFSLLSDEIVFTVNQLPKNPNFCKFNTNVHMWTDENFYDIDLARPGDIELLECMRDVNAGKTRPLVFYRYSAKNMVEKYGLDKELNIHYFMQGGHEITPKGKVEFEHFIPAFSTVVHYLICLAVYMGVSEIYLLGCDCTSIINVVDAHLNMAEKSIYGYEISENEKFRLERVLKKNTVREELRSMIKLFDDYKRLFEYCRNNGVQLYNATSPTLLDTVPTVDLYKVLRSNGSAPLSEK